MIFTIISKLLSTPTEHISSNNSLDSKLAIGSMCPVGILDTFEDMAKTAKCSTQAFAVRMLA